MPNTLARVVADSINPALAVLVAAAPLASSRPHLPWRVWGVSILAIAVPVALAEAGKAVSIWPGRSSFPSGHETFALAAATCVWRCRPQWFWGMLTLCALLAWALVAAQYHTWLDIAGAALLGPLASGFCLRRFSVRTENEES